MTTNDPTNAPPTPGWKCWIERLAGALLLVAGAGILQAGELKTRHLHYHGATAFVAGTTVVLLALLLLRGRIYATGNGRTWTRADVAAGVLMALGFAACVGVRLWQFFTDEH
jgi:hypothetical protein